MTTQELFRAILEKAAMRRKALEVKARERKQTKSTYKFQKERFTIPRPRQCPCNKCVDFTHVTKEITVI
jgi:hypothetical protein